MEENTPLFWLDFPEELKLSRYSISSHGHVKNKQTGRIQQREPNPYGYIPALLKTDDKKIIQKQTHQFVELLFFPRTDSFEPNTKREYTIDHIDGDRTNNHAHNLRRATMAMQRQNQKTHKQYYGRAICLTDENGNLLKKWNCISEAERELHLQNLSRECHRFEREQKRVPYNGYYFCYEEVNEEWFVVHDFPTIECTKSGKVRIAIGRRKGYILNGRNSVYNEVYFYDGKEMVTKPRQVLICSTFHGPMPFPNAEVNHKNGNKFDNDADNLEWCSHAENIQHAHDSGFFMKSKKRRAEKMSVAVSCWKNGTLQKSFSSVKEANSWINAQNNWSGNQKISRACDSGKMLAGFEWKFDNPDRVFTKRKIQRTQSESEESKQ